MLIEMFLRAGLGILAFNLYRSRGVLSAAFQTSIPFVPTGAESDEFQSRCRDFQPRIENAKVEVVQLVAQGGFVELTYRDLTCGGVTSPVVAQDVCRIALYLATSDHSGVQFEAWFPKNWNGRFLATGNGGLNGCKSSQDPSLGQMAEQKSRHRLQRHRLWDQTWLCGCGC